MSRLIIGAAAAASLDATLAREAEVQGELGAQPAHREGMQAFVEKRSPDFRTTD